MSELPESVVVSLRSIEKNVREHGTTDGLLELLASMHAEIDRLRASRERVAERLVQISTTYTCGYGPELRALAAELRAAVEEKP